MCGIVGIFKHEGPVNVELYEGLLMLQHRGQDSAGMVCAVYARLCKHTCVRARVCAHAVCIIACVLARACASACACVCF